jgi:poly(hydroxyalkanoate) depolymerase family esterase
MKNIFLLILTALVMSSSALAKRVTFPMAGRMFTLVVPERASQEKRPLVLLLHGCTQNINLMLDGTGLEKLAEEYNFYLLTPEQSAFHNPTRCWNWFLSINQNRYQMNEMSQIMMTLEMVLQYHPINRERVFVTGLSAGGGMTENLMICYPDYFKGAAIHSGLAYKTAENISEAQTVLESRNQKSAEYLGEKAAACAPRSIKPRLKEVMIIHGEADKKVPLLHADLLTEVHSVWQDYLDDGVRNNSQYFFEENSIQEFPHGYSIKRSQRFYKSGLIESTLKIQGLGHAWGGPGKALNHFDSLAPSSSELILEFFKLKN